MGHDISGINQSGEEIAYARFAMWNYNANILYDLLDAQDYNGGVSGIGTSAIYTRSQLEKALRDFRKDFKKDLSTIEVNDLLSWDYKQILEFMENCLETAKKEGRVRIIFC